VIAAGDSGLPFALGDAEDPAVRAFADIVDRVIESATPRGRTSIPLSV
jgi:hypothetical protein